MKTIRAKQSIVVPKGITVKIASRRVEVTGPHGKLTREFRHLPVQIQKIDAGRKIEVGLYFGLSKQIACLRTVGGVVFWRGG